MRIDSNNKEEFENIDIHDAELLDIFCDYKNHMVSITAKLNIPGVASNNIHLKFNEFSFFSISCEEPWGCGMYFFGASIEDSDVEKENSVRDDSEEKLTCKLILNSGDQIIISSSWIEWFIE